MSELTLYQIDETLAQLLMYREDREADTAEPMTEEEREVLNGEIAKYLHAELPRKVESFTALVRKWRMTASIAKTEARRYKEIADQMEAREKRLLGFAAEVLEKQPAPAKGCKKLVGADGSQLLLKGNGGVQPLEIPNPELVPEEYCEATVKLPLSTWKRMCEASPLNGHEGAEIHFGPSNARIRAALAQPCSVCGDGAEYTDANGDPFQCPTCGGTGKQGVPGACLLPRGAHVEVK